MLCAKHSNCVQQRCVPHLRHLSTVSWAYKKPLLQAHKGAVRLPLKQCHTLHAVDIVVAQSCKTADASSSTKPHKSKTCLLQCAYYIRLCCCTLSTCGFQLGALPSVDTVQHRGISFFDMERKLQGSVNNRYDYSGQES